MTDFPGREARLKPEFAHLYPAITAGHWDSAAFLADRIVSWFLRNPKAGFIATDRILPHSNTSTFAETLPGRPRCPRVNRAAVIRNKGEKRVNDAYITDEDLARADEHTRPS